MNALSTITILPETKAEIKTFKNMVIEELKNGTYNPCDIAIRFKAIETLIKEIQVDEDFKKMSVQSAEYNGKNYEYSSAKVEVAELGTKYDYSSCGDSELKQLENQSSMLATKIKARQEWLKSLKEPMPNEDGELCYAPVKSSQTGIKITLK